MSNMVNKFTFLYCPVFNATMQCSENIFYMVLYILKVYGTQCPADTLSRQVVVEHSKISNKQHHFIHFKFQNCRMDIQA